MRIVGVVPLHARATSMRPLRIRNSTSECHQELAPGLRPHNTARLPNGFFASYVSKGDVDFLYREVYEEKQYLQHGIELSPGDTVVDVGANIGFFSMYCAEIVGPKGRVVSAEPIPKIFSVLDDNLRRHHAWCRMRGVASPQPVVMNVGVGRMDGQLDFTFYTHAAGWSTMYGDEREVEEAMGVYLAHSLESGIGLTSSAAAQAGSAVRQWLAPPLWNMLWRAYVGWMLGQKRHISCDLVTLSSIIRLHQLRQIDLLKIDVERAELDVLQGLTSEDLARVRQIVVEAHEGDGRLSATLDLLRAAGMCCHVAQDAQLAGSTIYIIYATRQESLATAKARRGIEEVRELSKT